MYPFGWDEAETPFERTHRELVSKLYYRERKNNLPRHVDMPDSWNALHEKVERLLLRHPTYYIPQPAPQRPRTTVPSRLPGAEYLIGTN